MQEAKIGNQRENQFLQLVYNYQDALEDPDANKDLLDFYKAQIAAYTSDDIDKAIMNQISVMVADPEFMDRNEDVIENAGGINKYFELYAKNFRQIIESI